MGKAVLKNPRVVTVTDPIFGPRKEVQADLYDVPEAGSGRPGYGLGQFICIVSLGKPVEFEPDEEPAPPSAFRPTT